MLANWIVLEHQLSEEYRVDDTAITLLNVRTIRHLEKKISRVIRRCFLDIHLYMCDSFFVFTSYMICFSSFVSPSTCFTLIESLSVYLD